MQKEALEALIADLVTPLLDGTDLTLVDVEYVREKDWYLRIYIDKPGGVEIDDCQLVSEKLTTAAYGSKVDISFFAPWEGLKDLVGILISHSDETIEIKTIIKGKEAKNPVSIDRKLIAMIRPHIDF